MYPSRLASPRSSSRPSAAASIGDLLPATTAVKRDRLEWLLVLDPRYDPVAAAGMIAALATGTRDRYVTGRLPAWGARAVTALRAREAAGDDAEVLGFPASDALEGLLASQGHDMGGVVEPAIREAVESTGPGVFAAALAGLAR